ncbi:hypothetical protein BDQ12DRAFT_629392 [Crucibulum laeve]|uniref:Uncharacterized protein n=1 Tax=Crucibulum laeve TaxID=68775 RepID=A0A5C3M3M6_9AGAR|nr:hypothetical protein BDQ12DRAFT_629392 [Crucibulum laeve]
MGTHNLQEEELSRSPTSFSSAIYSQLPAVKMTSFDTYNTKTTSISFPWPASVTGLERIALSAQGDLQRVLSAFFAHPITIALVYSHTFTQDSPTASLVPLTLPNHDVIASASPTSPIIQNRQVHLQCNGKIVCTATSSVRITSPECAQLFLEEKYAIGQMFRRLEKVPAFHLLSVGLGEVDGSPTHNPATEKYSKRLFTLGSEKANEQQLWRKYKLIIPDFECEILEVFPSREMFVHGESWLTDAHLANGKRRSRTPESDIDVLDLAVRTSRIQQNLILVIGLGFLLILAFEVSRFKTGTGLHGL